MKWRFENRSRWVEQCLTKTGWNVGGKGDQTVGVLSESNGRSKRWCSFVGSSDWGQISHTVYIKIVAGFLIFCHKEIIKLKLMIYQLLWFSPTTWTCISISHCAIICVQWSVNQVIVLKVRMQRTKRELLFKYKTEKHSIQAG